MSITGIKKRLAVFYDDKGDYIGQCGFSKTDQTFDYRDRTYNVKHDEATYFLMKRWYWNLEIYHYNINNPDPFLLNKRGEPIMDAEMYNIQMKTKVARDLNDLNKGGIKLDTRTILIGLAVLVVLYLLMSGKIKL